jgi:hypothetical protein
VFVRVWLGGGTTAAVGNDSKPSDDTEEYDSLSAEEASKLRQRRHFCWKHRKAKLGYTFEKVRGFCRCSNM